MGIFYKPACCQNPECKKCFARGREPRHYNRAATHRVKAEAQPATETAKQDPVQVSAGHYGLKGLREVLAMHARGERLPMNVSLGADLTYCTEKGHLLVESLKNDPDPFVSL